MVVSNSLFIQIALIGLVSLQSALCNRVDLHELGDSKGEVKTSTGANIITAYVDEEDSDGEKIHHEFKAPLFNPAEAPFPTDLKEFSDDAMQESIELLKSVPDLVMVQGLSEWKAIPKLVKIGAIFVKRTFVSMRKYRALMRENNRSSDGSFSRELFNIIPDILQRSGETDENSEVDYTDKEGRIRVGRRLMLILDGWVQLAKASPNGFHLNLRKMTIDGELMLDEVVESLRFMQENGFGFVIKLFRKYFSQIQKRYHQE